MFSKCIMDRIETQRSPSVPLEGWEGVVKLTKECFDFSKWVSSPACSFMTDADVDDDECVEFLKPI